MMNEVTAQSLVGEPVCHVINGIGRVVEYQEERDMVHVEFGYPYDRSEDLIDETQFETDLERRVAMRFNYRADKSNILTVLIKSDRILGVDSWFLPPSRDDLKIIRGRVRRGPLKSRMIMPGSRYRARFEDLHSRLVHESSNAEYLFDDMYRRIVKLVKKCVDDMWGIYLSRRFDLDETQDDYLSRFASIQRRLDAGKPILDDVIKNAPEEAVANLVECVYHLALLHSYVEETSMKDSISELSRDIKDRIHVSTDSVSRTVIHRYTPRKKEHHVKSSQRRRVRPEQAPRHRTREA